jgi:DNA-binding transcriptional LysR family regulator
MVGCPTTLDNTGFLLQAVPSMERPSLDDMAILVAVIERGGFTGAARAMSLPKSTVSRRIAALEARLGARLLHRTTRTVRPTEAGAAFYERAGRIVADARAAEQSVRALREGPAGLLRVTCPPIYAELVIASVAVEYLRAFPETRLAIDVSERPARLIEEGFDVAVRVGMPRDSSLVARRLGPARRRICASPDYLEREGTPRGPTDLGRHACVVGRATERWRLGGPHGAREVAVRGRLITRDVQVARRAVLDGLALALLPEALAAGDLAAGRLRSVLDRWTERSDAAVLALFPSGRQLQPGVRAFVELLASHHARIERRLTA